MSSKPGRNSSYAQTWLFCAAITETDGSRRRRRREKRGEIEERERRNGGREN